MSEPEHDPVVDLDEAAASAAADAHPAEADPDEAATADPDGAATEAAADEAAAVDVETDIEDASASESESRDASASVSESRDDLAVVSRERDDYLDALRRLQADFENYKKRVMKQQTEHLERAAASLVEKLLPTLDTADLAVSHGSGEDVEQLRTALLDVLAREGLERLDPAGGAFDPNLHDAVAHEPGEGDQEVAEVLRAGYRWKGRVLRPAMVKVRG